MRLKDKAQIIGDAMARMDGAESWQKQRHPIYSELVDLVSDTRDTAYAVYDAHYLEETWSETFIRYQKRGFIKRDVVEEYFCRIVLEGLHNDGH